MRSHATDSPQTLLALINRQLEIISELQHRLAERRLILKELATRLRLGESAATVRHALDGLPHVAGLPRWSNGSQQQPAVGRAERGRPGPR